MATRKFIHIVFSSILIVSFLFGGVGSAFAQTQPPTPAESMNMNMAQATPPPPRGGTGMNPQNMKMITPADRIAAAERAKAARSAPGAKASSLIPQPGGVPDYFGIYPNYANSQLPELDTFGKVISGTGIRKFVDTLPGLGYANRNDLGQYIPVAVPDTTTYPGSDYYEIELREFTEQLHKDLPPTKLRGYVQVNTTDPTVSVPSYLGPIIVAQKDRPVRIKFTNKLPTGAGGDLFIPVDTTDMGAGMGPNGGTEMYTQNRATLHLHGGLTPWISDGTPHQWTTPAGENTSYPKGVSVSNVPDMPDPGPGSLTFFYSNQQSARLMFYHDHSYGITRLNVYAGEAAGYLLQDLVEKGLISAGTIPSDTFQVPLIIQDKTFVPKPAQLAQEDPTWDSAKYGGQGNLWFPHVYMPNQNPYDLAGANAMGRWDYGPWFWPPYTGLVHGPVDNPYYVPGGTEPPKIPGTPNPSLVPEGFMDTPLVNGTAYPSLTVQPRAYRFRILNASNDRFWNLQLYTAKSNNPMWSPSGVLLDANAGEVPMVPAVATPGFPATWPTDGRTGGVPDPAAAGPKLIQIGTEGGFLPAPVVLDNQPIGYNYNRRDIVVLNVSDKTLFLGPAERADVVVDFSQYAGKTLILYNDAPAPVPAFDPRNDYYTGNPDQTNVGGAPSTLPGYGPNTRTIMQIKVASLAPTGDALTGVTVTNGGADYTSMPAVSFSGGGGSGAAGTATGSVETIAILNGGSGYTTPPTVTVSGGGGTVVTATATVVNGVVTGVTILNGGSGFTTAPTVGFTPGPGGGSGASATAYLAVSAITLSSFGSGYTSAPNVNLIGGGGYGAIAVANLAVGTPYNLTALNTAFASTSTTPGVFAAAQDPIIVPQAAYNSAYNASYPADAFVRIQDTSMTFNPAGSATPLKLSLEPKAIQELFETQYGRMNAVLGVEIPNTSATTQTTIPYGFIDPPTEDLKDSITPMSPVAGDGTQIWKITHNGVDTHAIHFHLFNVQLINRVGWDGAIRPPDPNELGWKETVRMNPLEDAIVALRPVAPRLPFGVPDSIRPYDVTSPLGSLVGFTNVDPNGNPITVINQLFNFGWEYVWHCHLLGHEENDMMRPISFRVVSAVPGSPSPLAANTTGSTSTAPKVTLTWTDATPPTPANLGNPANEIGFRIERAVGNNGAFVPLFTTLANQTSYVDETVGSATNYRYRVVAFNVAGSSTSNTVTVTTPAGTRPISPQNLTASVLTGIQVRLNWTRNTANTTGYVLSRTGGTASFTPVNLSANTSSYTDATVVFGVTYTYSLVATNNGLNSAPATVTILAVLPPNAPSNLRSTFITANSITMVWRDNQVTPPETGYEVWVSRNGTNWTLAGTVGSNVTTFTAVGLTTATNYFYRVRAYTIVPGTPTLYSAWSNTINVRTR